MVLCASWKSQMVNYEETTLYDSISDSCRTVVNETLSAWYEIWVLGYDLHTGDTICTPIDPFCIWFHKKDITYNVGNYTFLDSATWFFPFNWKVPQYTLISCLDYAEDLQITYHYDIHVFGYFVPYYSMQSPPHYYEHVKSNPQPHAGHRPTPSGRQGINPPSISSGNHNTSITRGSFPNQHFDNQRYPKDSIHRVADTIRFRQEEQVRQKEEQQRIQQQRDEKAKQEAEQQKLKKQQEEKEKQKQLKQQNKSTQIKKSR